MAVQAIKNKEFRGGGVCVCVCVCVCVHAIVCGCKRHYLIEREKSDTVPTLGIV